MARIIPALLVLTLLLPLSPGAAQQRVTTQTTVSPNLDRALLNARDTASLAAMHGLLSRKEAWGRPDPDVGGLAEFIAPDAVLLGRFGEIVRGREEILRWWRRMLSFGDLTLMRLTLGASGGIIYETGRYRHMMRQADGRGRLYQDLGSYAWQWERQRDGTWKLQSLLMAPEPNPGSPLNRAEGDPMDDQPDPDRAW